MQLISMHCDLIKLGFLLVFAADAASSSFAGASSQLHSSHSAENISYGHRSNYDQLTKNHGQHTEMESDSYSALTFYHAVIASLSVIIVSELGDKTWFIAAIMAMTHSRLTIYCGAMAALILMTLLSAGVGWLTQVIPRALTYYASTFLFAIFGLKMIHEGYHMSQNEGQEEYEEAKAEIQKKEMSLESSLVSDMESGVQINRNSTYAVLSFVSALFLEAFTLTFLAEWGDRSQLTTIVLAARENVYGVVLGSILGHALCTGIAVVGGKLVATQISVRTVTLIGGVVFVIFALSALFVSPD